MTYGQAKGEKKAINTPSSFKKNKKSKIHFSVIRHTILIIICLKKVEYVFCLSKNNKF